MVSELLRFAFKSYCWAVGTTSFRTVDFNVSIERQLSLLNRFWAFPENSNKIWRDVQHDYYRFMQEQGFVKGDAPNPTKDAREKTSGLTAIGLIDGERKLTSAGAALLSIAESKSFGRDNRIQIPNDSFIYLKQLLKMSCYVDENPVRPFVVTAYVLLKLGNLSYDEFTYLLPMCTTQENTKSVIDAIKDLRNGIGNIDEIITSRLMAMDNYKAALDYFLAVRVTEDVITAIGMNRKSGGSGEKAYDKPYYPFYLTLLDITLNRNANAVLSLYEQTKELKNKPATMWRQFLFNTSSRSKLERDGLTALNDVPLLRAKSENEFKKMFFEQMHLFKSQATLSDYFDLNRRYFKTSDVVIFADGKVELDVLPRCWLCSVTDNLLEIAFTPTKKLTDNAELHEIASFLVINEHRLYENLEMLYGIAVSNTVDVNHVINDERYKRFNAMINERFNRAALIDLFGKFKRREDDAIRQVVTNNADIPTIFEYVLGIAWYIISDRHGDILSYMNLSLEADLLPRTHASGGNADIVYIYEQTTAYPAHTLLIEATLTDGTNQRRMEIEPVSRHLGDHILSTDDENAYCVFVSTFLDRNVISDFRNRRTYEHYSHQYEHVVKGLKILPLATVALQTILERGIGYKQLYALFESAYRSDKPVPIWYEQEVVKKLEALNGCGDKT